MVWSKNIMPVKIPISFHRYLPFVHICIHTTEQWCKVWQIYRSRSDPDPPILKNTDPDPDPDPPILKNTDPDPDPIVLKIQNFRVPIRSDIRSLPGSDRIWSENRIGSDRFSASLLQNQHWIGLYIKIINWRVGLLLHKHITPISTWNTECVWLIQWLFNE